MKLAEIKRRVLDLPAPPPGDGIPFGEGHDTECLAMPVRHCFRSGGAGGSARH
jgi:hypothetical protein